MNHATGTKLRLERLPVWQDHVTGVIFIFRLFLGVQMIEVAEKLIKAVIGGQMLIAIAQMVLAKLAGGITSGLEQTGDGGIFHLHSFLGTRQPNL